MNASAHVAALLTPAGTGAVAVVAARGPDIIRRIKPFVRLRSGQALGDLPTAKVALADLLIEGRRLDQGLFVIRHRSPEVTSVEVHCHGSPRLTQRLMAALNDSGVTPTDPASVGRVGFAGVADDDLTPALARARTRRAVTFLLAQAEALPGYLRRLGAQASALTATRLGEQLDTWLNTIHTSNRILDGVCLALVGPPNAGKTTLANRLLGENRLLVSAEAGTTRDWSEEPAAIRGFPITITDTAGRRATEHAVEREAIRRGLARAAEAAVTLLVLDGSIALPGDVERLAGGRRRGSLIWVANKCDLATQWDVSCLPMGPDERCVRLSAATGAGIPDLEEAILAAAGLGDGPTTLPCLWAESQVQTIERCRRLLGAGRLEEATRLLGVWATDGRAPPDPTFLERPGKVAETRPVGRPGSAIDPGR